VGSAATGTSLARLPTALLTRHILGYEILHLLLTLLKPADPLEFGIPHFSLGLLQLGDPLAIGVPRLLHALHLLLELGGVCVPPGRPGASGRLHPEPRHAAKRLETSSCAGGALVAAVC